MRKTLKSKISEHLLSGKALSSMYVYRVWNGQPDSLTKEVYKLRKTGIPIDLVKGKPSRYRINDSYFLNLAREKNAKKV